MTPPQRKVPDMPEMSITARAAVYGEWRAAGDLPGHFLYSIAYHGPAWDRTVPHLLTRRVVDGWTGYQNAAAIRQLTAGEPQTAVCAWCVRERLTADMEHFNAGPSLACRDWHACSLAQDAREPARQAAKEGA